MDDDTVKRARQPYFRLPLAALPYLAAERDNLHAAAENLICWAVRREGARYRGTDEIIECWNWFHDTMLPNEIAEWELRGHAAGFDGDLDLDLDMAAGAWRMRISPPDFTRMALNAKAAESGMKKRDVGSGVTLSIKSDDLMDLRDGKMTVEEFSVLAAIRSCLGRHKARMITRRMIAARIAGYASPKKAPDDWEPSEIELQRMMRTVERLHKRGRFNRYTWNRRHTFYSTRLKHDKLAELVGRWKERSQKRRLAKLDQEISAQQKYNDARQAEIERREKLTALRQRGRELNAKATEARPAPEPMKLTYEVASKPEPEPETLTPDNGGRAFWEVPPAIRSTGRVYCDELHTLAPEIRELVQSRGTLINGSS